MSLKAQVQAAVELAFSAAGDLVGTMTLVRQQQASYDPATGDTVVHEVEFDFEGVIEKAEERTQGISDTASGGTEVDHSKASVVLKPASTDPLVGDVLRINGKRHRILVVDPVKPDGVTVVLWTLVVAV